MQAKAEVLSLILFPLMTLRNEVTKMNDRFKTLPLFSTGLVPLQTHATGRVKAGQAAQIYFDSTTVLTLFEKAGIGECILTLKKHFTFNLLMFIYCKTVRLILPCTCQMSAYTLISSCLVTFHTFEITPKCMYVYMQAFLQSAPLQM